MTSEPLVKVIRCAEILLLESTLVKLEELDIHAVPYEDISNTYVTDEEIFKRLRFIERSLYEFDIQFNRNRKLHNILQAQFSEIEEQVEGYRKQFYGDGWVSLPYNSNNFAIPKTVYDDGIFVYFDRHFDTVVDNNVPNELFRAATYAYETRQRLYFACRGLTRSALASFSRWHTEQGLEVPPIFFGGTVLDRPSFETIDKILKVRSDAECIHDRCGIVSRAEISNGRIKLFGA